MEVFNQTTLSFGFQTEDQDEVQTFTEIWLKIYRESKKTGFKNMFNRQEEELIQGMQIEWFGEKKEPDGIDNMSNNQTFVSEE